MSACRNFVTGIQFHAGDLKIQPEFAIVMAAEGSSALTTDQRLRFGDRAGAESNQPGVEARVVFQFPLNHDWKGVAPAQIIFSGHHARMNEIIQSGNQANYTCVEFPCTVPIESLTAPNVGFSNTYILGSNCADPLPGCRLSSFFPHGTQVGDPQNIWTAEVQLPTPWVTFDAKYYRGNNMRFFFGGQLNDVYNNLNGMFEVGNGISFSGRAVLAGCTGGSLDPNSGTAAYLYKTIYDCPGTSAVQMANLVPPPGPAVSRKRVSRCRESSKPIPKATIPAGYCTCSMERTGRSTPMRSTVISSAAPTSTPLRSPTGSISGSRWCTKPVTSLPSPLMPNRDQLSPRTTSSSLGRTCDRRTTGETSLDPCSRSRL
jgi:hypothetical protein